MIKPEFKVQDVSVSIGLSFEGFDFVVDTFYRSTRDFV